MTTAQDLLPLLREARSEFMHVIAVVPAPFERRRTICKLVEQIDAAISSLEAAPERKCGTCKHYYKDEAWCRNDASPSFSFAGPLIEHWFFADYQAKQPRSDHE